MEMLVEYVAGGGGSLSAGLRPVMLSGDWIPPRPPAKIRALPGRGGLQPLGGATEASIWSISSPGRGGDSAWRSIPYGRPMLNQTFQALDEGLEPRPVWVPGDLYIGGVGLAQGYWRDEEKTRASFITHPSTGERLYRTGDLGRYLPGGEIEFLGRKDFQVKIQGYRVELGEIEAVLAQHPSVRSAVVAVVGEAGDVKRLAGFVVAEGGGRGWGARARTSRDSPLPARSAAGLHGPGRPAAGGRASRHRQRQG